MKFNLILPALAGLILTQLAPQAAWSWDGCRGGYESPREVRHEIRRAERFGYAAPYGYAPYRYGPAPCYRGGLLGTFGRAIF
jgi:hypothetical protein